MKTFFLFLIAFTLFAGDTADKTPPSPKVQKVLSVYEKSVAAAKKVYDQTELKARQDVIKALEKLKSDLTKDGNLEGAMAAKDAINRLNAGDVIKPEEVQVTKNDKPEVKADKPESKAETKADKPSDAGTDLLGRKFDKTVIIGAWKCHTDEGWDGSITVDENYDALLGGVEKGKVVMNSDGTFTISLSGGMKFAEMAWRADKKIFRGKVLTKAGEYHDAMVFTKLVK